MNDDVKTALITGAAERIGAAVAMALHGRGCKVLIHCNSQRDKASSLVADLNSIRKGSSQLLCADLSSLSGVEQLAATCLQHTQKLDVLVNNASRFYATEAGKTRPGQWDDLINTNLRGPYFLCQHLLEPLRSAGGVIVNILDVHAQRPMRDHGVYCISKAGLAMMTQAMARDLGPDIRVNGVSPGAIVWPLHGLDETQKAGILQRTVLQRLGTPADIGSAVAFLALDAPYVTGQILAVDGGRLLNI